LRRSRQASEFRVGFIVAGARRWVTGFRPREVRFAHARDGSRRAVETLIGCPVSYARETTEMLFEAGQLALPVSAADPYLLAVLERHAEELLARREQPRDALRERAGRLVVRDLPKGVPTAGRVAAALGLSERTFARRLHEEGTSFRQIVDDVRREMARSYLSDPAISLAQVAYLLGYADQSAFSNSFRRWTGQSPRRFRAERWQAAGASPPA
jgi:AraC-like DNA-binding protein